MHPVNSLDKSNAIGMVAGEASGDLIAGLLLERLRQKVPGLRAMGIGGPAMERQGFTAWWPHKRLSLMGFGWDVMRQLRGLFKMRGELEEKLLNERIKVFIGIDAPDFNLTLEKKLRLQGVKTIHYVCPSIWAWRLYRVTKLKASCDHVLCVFPFEPALLAQYGIPATFIGHPLAQVIPLEPDRHAARARLNLPQTVRILAVLPGSRSAEIKNLTPRFFEAAKLLMARHADLHIVVPCVPQLQAVIESTAASVFAGTNAMTRVHCVQGQSHAALEACDLALVASGTATLETALYKRPMVIAYELKRFSRMLYSLWKNKETPWVGLPNILLRRFAVPEILHEKATPTILATALEAWIQAIDTQSDEVKTLTRDFMTMHQSLLCDTKSIACHVIEEIINA